jgi:hypothetical protein
MSSTALERSLAFNWLIRLQEAEDADQQEDKTMPICYTQSSLDLATMECLRRAGRERNSQRPLEESRWGCDSRLYKNGYPGLSAIIDDEQRWTVILETTAAEVPTKETSDAHLKHAEKTGRDKSPLASPMI